MGRAGAADGGPRPPRPTRPVHVRAEAAPLKVFRRRPYTPNLRYLFQSNGISPCAVARPPTALAAADSEAQPLRRSLNLETETLVTLVVVQHQRGQSVKAARGGSFKLSR